jgi:hypothetical protein
MDLDHGVMHLAAREHIGERMADEFADAQLALRRASSVIAMLTTSHLLVSFNFALSSSAKADDPVIAELPVATGCPAFAGHDDDESDTSLHEPET